MKPSELKNAFAPLPDMCYGAMMTAAHGVKEETVVKKRLSLALIVTIALMAAAVTAFAVAYWRNTAEEIAAMEAEHGYFEDWTAEDKATIVRLLYDAGELPESPELNELLDNGTAAARKGELAAAVMTALIRRPEEAVSLISVMETIRGSFAAWPAEDKVWYHDMLERLGMLGTDHMAYAVPEGTEITQEQAVLIAKETFHEVYGVSIKELDAFEVQPTFMTVNWEPDEGAPFQNGDRLWSILLISEDPDTHEYTVYHSDISAAGEALSHTCSKNGVLIHSTYD